MSSFGGFGIFPIQFGGGSGEQELIYRALASIVGEGGSSVDDLEVTTLDGALRAAKAKGLAAGFLVERAAHWQAMPSTVSDELATYEEILAISPPPTETEEDRRQEVVRRWTLPAHGDFQHLRPELQRIDSRFVILDPVWREEAGGNAGRYYDAIGKVEGSGSFGLGKVGSHFPAFSDSYHVAAVLPIPNTPLEGDLRRLVLRAEELLARRIPAWCDYTVGLEPDGFELSIAFLDEGDFLDAALFGTGGFVTSEDDAEFEGLPPDPDPPVNSGLIYNVVGTSRPSEVGGGS